MSKADIHVTLTLTSAWEVAYAVRPWENGHAVVKVGPRGGTRHVATYADVTTAERVAEILNQYWLKEL